MQYFVFFCLYFFVIVNGEKKTTNLFDKLASNCYYLDSKSSCTNVTGCSWCNDVGYDKVYSCYETIDDCDCVKQSGYDDCVKISKCHYCNFGTYGGRYCISKDVECS